MPKQTFITDEEVTSPLHEGEERGIELNSLDVGYALTKEHAKSIMIIEPVNREPMTLFDYFIHEISQAAMKKMHGNPYGNEMKRDFDRLIQTLHQASATDDIKTKVRLFFNQLELASMFQSRDIFLERERANLNTSLNFQPPITLSSAAKQDSEPKKSRYFGKNKRDTPEQIAPMSPEDKWNVTSSDIKEDWHHTVERIIETSNYQRAIRELKEAGENVEIEEVQKPYNQM